jgi:hypothetical protein
VWADGKIYATEVNGLFHIIEPSEKDCKILDSEKVTFPDGRYAEIYSSPAVAYDRIYFASEMGVYCLGDKSKSIEVTDSKTSVTNSQKQNKELKPAQIQIRPAELIGRSGEQIQFTAHAFDENGTYINKIDVDWEIKGIDGNVDGSGNLKLSAVQNDQAGEVIAKMGGLKGTSRMRVYPDLPWKEDFDSISIGSNPDTWIGTSTNKSPANRFIVQDDSGNKVLAKPVSEKGIQRGVVFLGPAEMKNYIIQADVKDQKYKRKRGDVGLISHGYEIDLMGKVQKLQLRSWISELRIEKTIPFNWDPEVWYTVKLEVDLLEDKAIIKGKVWLSNKEEPADWTITTEDPHPVRFGSPGIYGVSYTEVSFDNVIVTKK